MAGDVGGDAGSWTEHLDADGNVFFHHRDSDFRRRPPSFPCPAHWPVRARLVCHSPKTRWSDRQGCLFSPSEKDPPLFGGFECLSSTPSSDGTRERSFTTVANG